MVACGATDALAQQPPPAGPPPAQPPPGQPPAAQPPPPAEPRQPPLQPGEERELPDYSGREEPTTAGDVLIWVPRVVFFPAYVVTEYVVRRPVGALMIAAERGKWIQEVTEFFTFGPNNNIGIVPTALLDFGFQTSVGVYMFYDDFLGAEGNAFRVHAAFGGLDWLRLTVADRIPIDESAYLKLRFEGSTRPDFYFFGIGPDSAKDDVSRYKAEWLDFSGTFFSQIKGPSSLEFINAVRTTRFDPTCCGDETEPTLSTQIRTGRLEAPPGLEDGYTAYRQGLRLALDSRRPRPEPGSGFRLDLLGEHAVDLRAPGQSRWLEYGATVGGFLDITGQQRVVSLSVGTYFADPLGEREVPFTDLVQLGGDQPMRGFRGGRLMGRSAAVATLEYRYPIWALLDGAAQVAVGNVFGEHLDGLDMEKMRLAFSFGIRTSGERDHSFDILVGAGTETFEQGAELNDLRLVIGGTRHF
jgi:hypothetical protein